MYWNDEFALEEYGQESWSIWAELRDAVAAWQDTYTEYWGLGAQDLPEHLTEERQKSARHEHRMAEVIHQVVHALSITGAAKPGAQVNLSRADLKWLRDVLREYKKSPPANDWLALKLASDFVRQISDANVRAFRLVGIVHGSTMSDRATSYLNRVATLYLQGLELETGIMCRSALEAALCERLEEYCELDAPSPSLDEMLRIAGESNALSGYDHWPQSRRGWRPRTNSPLYRADRIRVAGNFIAHHFASYPPDRDAIRDAFEAIRELTTVLGELFPAAEAA